MKVMNKNSGTSVSTRAFGNKTRYAPMTPAMAPLAPTLGARESLLRMKWSVAAPSPANK